MPSHHLVLCHLLLILPSVFSSTRVFSNELALGIRWPKYWSFSFSMCHSNEYSGLISFRKDWFDLLAIQGTLKRLLQHHQFKRINSLAFRLFYCPALTFIHDYWKNNSFDYTDLYRQSWRRGQWLYSRPREGLKVASALRTALEYWWCSCSFFYYYYFNFRFF